MARCRSPIRKPSANTTSSTRPGTRRPKIFATKWSRIMAPILEDRKKHSATVMTDEVQAVIAKPAADRTPLEQQVYHIAETRFGGLGDPVRALKGDNAKRYAESKAQLASFDSIKPPPLPEGQFMKDLSATAPPTYILRGGSRSRRGRRSAAWFPFDSRSERCEDHAARRRSIPPAAAARSPPGSPIRRIPCPRA